MSEMRPRITGTEMEWAAFTRKHFEQYFEQASEPSVGRAIKSIDKNIKMVDDGGMMSNGGCYYRDVGSHPEYATPEDTSFYGTVINEFAGEQVVYDSFNNVENPELFDEFMLNKRVVDDELKTWGYHISLSADAKTVPITTEALAPLGVHLSTMSLYTGAGAIIPVMQSSMFTVAQKALNLNTDFSASSHNADQPLISLRAQALSNKELYSRVHITSLDANMSPWATWMKLGTTSIVLRLMEHGYLSREPYFGQPMHKVALSVAYDTRMSYPVERANGTDIYPLDVQIELVEKAEKLQKNEGLPDEENYVLAEWKQVLADMQCDPELAIDRVEWIRKRAILRAYIARNALSWSDPAVRNLDRRWSSIDPDGIGMRLRQGAWANWAPTPEQLRHAYLNPPSTTRAFARAALIHEYAQSPDDHFSASWDKASLASNDKEWVMDDPYSTTVEPTPISETDDNIPYVYGPHRQSSAPSLSDESLFSG